MPCAARAVCAVQRDVAILTSVPAKADSSTVITRLRQAIDSGEYCVDPDAVAEAILRRARDRARTARAALSAVLVSPEPRAKPATGSPQLHTPPFDDAA